MRSQADNFIITGTSGTGKTVLVEELRRRGHSVFEEAQRAILTEQLSVDGPALPAKNPALFIEALLKYCISCLAETNGSEQLSFFDRGIPDVAAYAIRFDVDPAGCFGAGELKQYNHHAFILPPWKEIFITDALRGKSFEEYLEFHTLIIKCYEKAGLNLIEVPLCSIQERADFVLDSISEF